MKRRDFLKGVVALIGGLGLFGGGKAKAAPKPMMGVDVGKQPSDSMYIIQWGNKQVLLRSTPKGGTPIHRIMNIKVMDHRQRPYSDKQVEEIINQMKMKHEF